MPISKHFGGKGAEVMASMNETYKDPAKAKSVFYATENKRKAKKKKPAPMPMSGGSGGMAVKAPKFSFGGKK